MADAFCGRVDAVDKKREKREEESEFIPLSILN